MAIPAIRIKTQNIKNVNIVNTSGNIGQTSLLNILVYG